MGIKPVLLTLLSFFGVLQLQGQKRIITPIEGVYGKDYIIVNYVDWGLLDTVKDLHCGTKSYNGHQGTDFTIQNFKQMDSGVAVLATDTGTVTFVQDGLFDKETVSVISKGLGNYIAIAHSGKFYSYYGHLKKNSITVKVGDKVLPGQKIGEVGSSGNSTDPHLHFEWWYDSSVLIDPFSGSCGNAYNYWKNPAPYDTSFKVWLSGLYRGKFTIDSLRFKLEKKTISGPFVSYGDSLITYGSLMYGLRKGDQLKIEWHDKKTMELVSDFEITMPRDYWYYYYWTYFNVPDISGPRITFNWVATVKRNGVQIDQQEIETAYVSAPLIKKSTVEMQVNLYQLQIINGEETELILFSVDGKRLSETEVNRSRFNFELKPYIGSTVIAQIVKNGQILKQQKIQVN